MRITFELPDKVWASLATIADERATRVPDLVAESVLALVERRTAPLVNRLSRERLMEELVRLHGRGYNDREIADHLGIHRERARTLRHRLRLPANDPRGARPSEKAAS